MLSFSFAMFSLEKKIYKWSYPEKYQHVEVKVVNVFRIKSKASCPQMDHDPNLDPFEQCRFNGVCLFEFSLV